MLILKHICLSDMNSTWSDNFLFDFNSEFDSLILNLVL